MSEHVYWKCDRCGTKQAERVRWEAELTSPKKHRLLLRSFWADVRSSSWDLCESCRRKLEQFMAAVERTS